MRENYVILSPSLVRKYQRVAEKLGEGVEIKKLARRGQLFNANSGPTVRLGFRQVGVRITIPSASEELCDQFIIETRKAENRTFFRLFADNTEVLNVDYLRKMAKERGDSR